MNKIKKGEIVLLTLYAIISAYLLYALNEEMKGKRVLAPRPGADSVQVKLDRIERKVNVILFDHYKAGYEYNFADNDYEREKESN